MLERRGHEVEVAGDGEAAVRLAGERPFDVVLMDVQMPVMDGLTAAAAIRALDGPAAAVPILALTASAMPGDREACLAAGMNDHLTKPITAATLFAALREVAAPPDAEGDEPFRSRTSA
jgi:CheY-like chemotaxis protein